VNATVTTIGGSTVHSRARTDAADADAADADAACALAVTGVTTATYTCV
jgi:hypothetical protein